MRRTPSAGRSRHDSALQAKRDRKSWTAIRPPGSKTLNATSMERLMLAAVMLDVVIREIEPLPERRHMSAASRDGANHVSR